MSVSRKGRNIRILAVRTDRIGDVVLSTPAVALLRENFADAYIAMVVSPLTEEIVSGNPRLDEVIVYDKKRMRGNVIRNLRFIKKLRKGRFDVALMFHTTRRMNILCFLAGIPRRIGYARGKMDFLLTDRLHYTKKYGERHEAEYTLDVLGPLGIKASRMPPTSIYVKDKDRREAECLLGAFNIYADTKFIVLHPGASDASKRWPADNFARVGDYFEKRGVRVALVSSKDQAWIGEEVSSLMESRPAFLCGRTSLGVLAAVLKRASIFISNDSGPVHIAASLGTPVVSIFSRKDSGLSPVRWRPIGEKAAVLHKDPGCDICLAHNCKKGFLCLRLITPEEVIDKAEELLS